MDEMGCKGDHPCVILNWIMSDFGANKSKTESV